MAGWDFDGPLRIAHYDYWLVSPIPTPHASTIRAANPQSSDASFHCLAITVFCWAPRTITARG